MSVPLFSKMFPEDPAGPDRLLSQAERQTRIRGGRP
jgi:hypothetical protein